MKVRLGICFVRGLLLALIAAFALPLCALRAASNDLVDSRDVRTWEFLDAIGQKAAILGKQSGEVEAWVHPLKLFKNFHLLFHSNHAVVPAEALARTVITRHESSTIVYAGADFSVRETFFVPLHEAGGVVVLDVDSFVPLEIEVQLEPDFQLAWPAAVGATYFRFDQTNRVFVQGAEGRNLFAVIGSPAMRNVSLPYYTNSSSSNTVSFRLGESITGKAQRMIAWAASTSNPEEVNSTYSKLLQQTPALQQQAREYYGDYLARTVEISLPDRELQTAYDWARVAMLQGFVENSALGYGVVAGYRTSWDYRAGFDWYFGRDSLWTSLALLAEGDLANARAVLDLLAKYQNADGKIIHELVQSARFVDWFRAFHYAYSSADSTPLFLIVARDYLRASGNEAWVKSNREHLLLAYRFLLSTRGVAGWPLNRGVGYGWVESGPLLPVEVEFYQAGLAVEAMRATSELARAMGDAALAAEAEANHSNLRQRLNADFWSNTLSTFGFALNLHNQLAATTTGLASVPLWWGLEDEAKARKTIDALASPVFVSDWGLRLLSEDDPLFKPDGYHFGAVWPLFTGWAAVGEYRYHRSLAAYTLLRANALLANSGAPGRVTEALSGSFFEPLAGSSPHQIWSSAMVVNPLLRGLFGLDARADGSVRLTTHLPATWSSASIRNVHAGGAIVSALYTRDGNELRYTLTNTGTVAADVTLSPALALSARIISAKVDGKAVPARLHINQVDQHLTLKVQVPPGAERKLSVRARNDFGLEDVSTLPARGARSRGLRFVTEQWSASRVRLLVAGAGDHEYEVKIGGNVRIRSVENATETWDARGHMLHISFPPGDEYQSKTVTIRFARK